MGDLGDNETALGSNRGDKTCHPVCIDQAVPVLPPDVPHVPEVHRLPFRFHQNGLFLLSLLIFRAASHS